MAIWHFRTVLLPRAAVLARYTVVPTAIPPADEDAPWWGATQPPPGFEAKLTELLPERASWSPEMRMFGEKDGHRAYVLYAEERGAVLEVAFELDVRRRDLSLEESVCRFAQRLDCLLLTKTFALLEPTAAALGTGIAASLARRFADDPAAALQSLSKEGPGDGSN